MKTSLEPWKEPACPRHLRRTLAHAAPRPNNLIRFREIIFRQSSCAPCNERSDPAKPSRHSHSARADRANAQGACACANLLFAARAFEDASGNFHANYFERVRGNSVVMFERANAA